ncbi:MAG: M20/M25/M40 family metallo-hydrolase [Gemmatimonadota bacterium]
MTRFLCCIALLFSVVSPAVSQQSTAAVREAREILAEMVGINTSIVRGDVTPLAEKLAARFRAAGIPAADVVVIGPEAKDRNLVVRIRGSGTAKPVLFLSHLDVVDALREDWSLDPFTLTEKDGWLYGRGTADDKGPGATLIAGMLALARSGVTPQRDIILALTSGEENGDVPGAQWLLQSHRELVDAEYVFNFDAGGPAIEGGTLKWLELQGSEKVFFTVALSVRNAGGHSSLPRADNAIYRLAAALGKLSALRFPIHLSDVTRAQLAAQARYVPAAEAAVIRAAIAQPQNRAAAERLAARSPGYNAILRTTCIPTMLTGGHAENALPALARATVNCRIIPGESADAVLATLRRTIADTAVAITVVTAAKPSPPSPLVPTRLALIDAAATATWGHPLPFFPVQENGATDGLFFRNAGIPVYGLTGIAMPTDEARMHGRDERIPVKSFAEGVVFATALIAQVANSRQ